MDKALEAKLDATIRKVDILQTTVDRSIDQQDGDMKRITDLEVKMGKVLAVLEGIREDIAGNHKKVISSVQENLSPVPDMVAGAVNDAVSDIKKKKWYKLFSK